MITFKNLAFILRKDEVHQARVNFDNGYGISVVQGPYLYHDVDTYEVAVIKDNKICCETPIADDILGYQTPEQIDEIMAELQSYQRNDTNI